MYPDAGGVRTAVRQMAEQLAGLGYVVLVPDVYYRSGDWAPFDMKNVFNDKAERQRLFGMIGSITPDAMESDARAFFDYLAARPEVSRRDVRHHGLLHGRTDVTDRRRSGARAGGRGDVLPRRRAGLRGPGQPAPAGRQDPRGGLRRRCRRRRLVHRGTGRDPRQGADRSRRRAHDRVVPALHGFAVPDNAPYDGRRPRGTGRR